ncbi:MAG: glycosyltransferase family 2 protein [Deltaproteobacteria bacterium]|nr:glycosyltransferase family 2 protein [Deltaproteobacteria bacterium]
MNKTNCEKKLDLPALVIPAYEPDKSLLEIVSNLGGSFSCTIVVNDGSSRQYQPLFNELERREGVIVLEHPVNRGKGAALKTAFNYLLLLNSHPCGVVTMDADGQHSCEDARGIVHALSQSPQTLYLGVRDFKEGAPWKSRIGNRVTRRLLKLFTRLNLMDTQTGLRGIPLRLLPHLLTIGANGYDFELEMLFTARRRGVGIAEIPVRTLYVDNNRKSHFNPLKDSAKIYFVFFRYLVGTLRSKAGEDS